MNSGQRESKPVSTAMVLESIEKVQRGLEIRNTRIGADDISELPASRIVAQETVIHGQFVNQNPGQFYGNSISDIRPHQTLPHLEKLRDTRVVPSNNLSIPPSSLPQERIPSQFIQAQNVLTTAGAPVGLSNSTAELLSVSDDSSVKQNNRNQASSDPQQFTFSVKKILIIIQVGIIFLFAIFVTYDEDVTAKSRLEKERDSTRDVKIIESRTVAPEDTIAYHSADYTRLQKYYPLYQDVHVMIFIGFGFLMTFLRKYGYSAVGYNFLIAAIAIQWAILCRGAFNHGLGTIPISITNLINGDFAAGAVLITFGAVLGVTSPLQMVIVCLIEVFLYALNEYIGIELFGAIDIGGSLIIHTFGAYFGLALSWTLRRQSEIKNTQHEEANTTSDLFAMIGTVFLWLYWPSFNGALAVGDDQHRAVINTVLSLCGSCVVSFAISALCTSGNKFSMVHVQNATLAGGVAVGATADLMLRPFGALLVGSFAGLLSTIGYVYIQPFLKRTIGLHDTCGVHNLHGMPGVFAGLVSVLMAGLANQNDYGNSLYVQYPARAPYENSSELTEIQMDFHEVKGGENRSSAQQAMFQLAALGVTLGIAIVGGAVTGLLLRAPFFGKVPDEFLFDDSRHWEIPEEEEPHNAKEQGVSLEMRNEKTDVVL